MRNFCRHHLWHCLIAASMALAVWGCYEDNYKERDNGSNGEGQSGENEESEKVFRYIFIDAFMLSDEAIDSLVCGVSVGLTTYRKSEFNERLELLKSAMSALADQVTTNVTEIGESDCQAFSAIETAATTVSSGDALPEKEEGDERASLHLRTVIMDQELGSTSPSFFVYRTYWDGWDDLHYTENENVKSLLYVVYTSSLSGYITSWLSLFDSEKSKSDQPISSIDPSSDGLNERSKELSTATQDVASWVLGFR